MQVESPSATTFIWTIQVSSHTSKPIFCCVQLNYTGLTMCKQQVPLLQHPSIPKRWLFAKSKSLCCSIHLFQRVDYVPRASPSAAASIYSKGLTMCKEQVPLLQHPSIPKGWLCAKSKSLCCSIHLFQRVDYLQTAHPSTAAFIYSKGLTTYKQQVPLLQHPSIPKRWLFAKSKSLCYSIHLFQRVDYVPRASPSAAASIYSKGLTMCKEQVPLLQHPSIPKGWLCA